MTGATVINLVVGGPAPQDTMTSTKAINGSRPAEPSLKPVGVVRAGSGLASAAVTSVLPAQTVEVATGRVQFAVATVHEMTGQQTVFEAVGGEPFFRSLAQRFYDGVATDAELLKLYPNPDDLTEATESLALFLMQYWGGPTTYSDVRGHPRLRMRHVPFTIGQAERDAWLLHMTAAVESAEDLDPELAQRFIEYFTMAADHLINS